MFLLIPCLLACDTVIRNSVTSKYPELQLQVFLQQVTDSLTRQ